MGLTGDAMEGKEVSRQQRNRGWSCVIHHATEQEEEGEKKKEEGGWGLGMAILTDPPGILPDQHKWGTFSPTQLEPKAGIGSRKIPKVDSG